jgi:hypothetical protein
MKVTIKKLRETNNALQALGATKLPAVAAMRVAAVMRALQGPMADFDKTFNALLAECGEPVPETPGQFKIKDEHIERFNKESTELHEHEIEVPGDPIPAQLFGNAEISPVILASLDWMVTV